MSMQDPIADMITRIRNAQVVRGTEVVMPSSHFKLAILHILKDEGYINAFEVTETDGKKSVTVELKYDNNDIPAIDKITRVSKPGLRVYKRHDQLPTVRAGMGIAIVSTPNGVMTGRTAKAKKLGGEVLCLVE